MLMAGQILIAVRNPRERIWISIDGAHGIKTHRFIAHPDFVSLTRIAIDTCIAKLGMGAAVVHSTTFLPMNVVRTASVRGTPTRHAGNAFLL